MNATAGQQRRAARETVASYHETCLITLVDQLTAALDDYRSGATDAHVADRTIHHYHRAADELWRFCWGAGTDLEFTAHTITTWAQPIDWWQRGAPHKRT